MKSNNIYVFGYGSLLTHFQTQSNIKLLPATLHGYRREWNVAMDNTVDTPGYRYFIDTKTRFRPGVYVTFLNITADESATTNGLLVPVSKTDLAAIDKRERNYYRMDVTTHINPSPDRATIYTYVGRSEARLRFTRGKQDKNAVISKAYLDGVVSGFRALGEDKLALFHSTTSDPQLPVVDLTEVKL